MGEGVFEPRGHGFGFEVGVEDDEEGVTVFECVAAFGLDICGAVQGEAELFEVKRGVSALAFMVSDDGDERAAVEYTGGIGEEAVPVIAFVAAVYEVAGHEVEGGIGALPEGVVGESAPAVQAILGVAHIDEGEGAYLIRGGGEFSEFGPAVAGAVANGVDVGGIGFESGESRGMAMDGGVIDEVGICEGCGVGFDFFQAMGFRVVIEGAFLVGDESLGGVRGGAPLDGLAGLGVVVPGEDDVVRLGGACVLGGAEESQEFSIGTAIPERLDEGQILQ